MTLYFNRSTAYLVRLHHTHSAGGNTLVLPSESDSVEFGGSAASRVVLEMKLRLLLGLASIKFRIVLY